jgi:hypothetical protein
LTEFRIKNLLSSTRNKVIIIAALAVTAAILLITKFYLKDKKTTSEENGSVIGDLIRSNQTTKPNLEILEKTLDGGIDSVFANFGIKKEWITTNYNPKIFKTQSKTPAKDVEWFSKEILIPKELSTIEVNLDLASYIGASGLSSIVNEDITTKDITINVKNPDTTKTSPLAKISVKHSDKVTRDAGIFAVILDNIGDYNEEEVDKYLINKFEFSYVFPRSLDRVNLQTKLLQNKKDVLINLTIGEKDNYDTDFHSGLDEKQIKEKIKSFSSDYPSISTVILTRTSGDVPKNKMQLIADELGKFNIKVISDSALVKLLTKADEDSKDKISIIVSGLKTKASLNKTAITMLKIEPDEFEKFYSEILVLKKLGYRFYNMNDYLKEEYERQKKETEKLKLEQEKKTVEKKVEKKNQVKKPEKKTPENKSGDKKKTNTKSKTTTTDKKKK